jgi:hypothetical protein
MLIEAKLEMLTSLRLEPGQLDAGNMLGVIYARQGDKARAAAQWRDLLRNAPDYGPARANLTILEGKQPAPAAFAFGIDCFGFCSRVGDWPQLTFSAKSIAAPPWIHSSSRALSKRSGFIRSRFCRAFFS